MTSKIQNASVDRLTSLINDLSKDNVKENSDEPLIGDIWNKIISLLNVEDIKNFSLVSRSVCIVTLKSTHYVWYIHNKPKFCNVISASISSLDKNHGNRFEKAGFFETLIKSGATDIAKKIIRKYKYCHDELVELIKVIVQCHIQQDNVQEAKNTLIGARNFALQSGYSNRWYICRILLEIIKLQVDCGDIDSARETLKDITRPSLQFRALIYIARSQVQCGHIDSVITTMEYVVEGMQLQENEVIEEYQNEILIEVDRLLIAMGNIPDANQTAQSLSEKYGRSEALWCIQVKGLVQNKRIDEAKRMLTDKKEEIPYKEDTEKEYYLRYIVAILSEIDSDGAKETLEQARQMVDKKTDGLLEVAKGQMHYGYIKDAKSTLESIIEMMCVKEPLLYHAREVVKLLIELDDFTTARCFISSCMPDDSFGGDKAENHSKADALHGVAKAQLKKGNKDDAKSTLEEATKFALLIQRSYLKIKTLLKIAQTTFQCVDIKKIEGILKNAEQCVDIEKIENILEESEKSMLSLSDYYKTKFLARIALLRFQMDMASVAARATLSKAKELAPNIPRVLSQVDAYHKDGAFVEFFKVYFQIGDIENMVKAFESIWYLDKKIKVLLQTMHIVEKQIESNARTVFISSIEGIQKILLGSNCE